MINVTYRKFLIDNFIKNNLQRGVPVSAFDVQDELDRLLETRDLTVPQFVASGHFVEIKENSSAAKFNATFREELIQDLTVLYQEMLNLSKVSVDAFERWKLEANCLEKRLIDLEDRIENLLLLTQDTGGFFGVIIDNFTDTSQTDLCISTAEVDLKGALITIVPSNEGATRIFLNDLDLVDDLTFRVRTSTGFLGRRDAVNSDLRNPFKQLSSSWWTAVDMKDVRPVTCELTVKLAEEPIPVSRIFIDLHDSSQSRPMVITPLYSIDNQIFTQLPTNTFSQEVRTNATFSFSEVDAKFIRFILTKRGPDPSINQEFFSYQFGFKEIAFFSEGFNTDPSVNHQFFSRPLSVIAEGGDRLEFEKLTLETCEKIETDTKIDYFVTTSNDPNVPVDQNTLWAPISPVNRAIPKYVQILDVGNTIESVIGDNETVSISYDGTSTDTSFINPSKTFRLLSKNATTGQVVDEEIIATAPRYSFANSNDRILNYQIKELDTGSGSGEGLELDENSLIIFRNVGEQGFSAEDITSKVRGIQRGWKFEDPFYSTVIEIENPDGMTINAGSQAIFIDDAKFTETIDSTVLTGTFPGSTGIHTIKVHKNNWKEVPPNLNNLAQLKAADTLYPFNHKLLIEGYSYGPSYPDTEEKIYKGADLFAQVVLRRTSIFDVINNIAANNFNFYAIDRDAPATHTGGNAPTKVFVLKVDESNPDLVNEAFVIRFNLVNQLRKFLRLRADLFTERSGVSPALHSYKIKLG